MNINSKSNLINKFNTNNNTRNQAHAMIASSSTINNEKLFFDTSAMYHLSRTTTSLDNIQSYKDNDKVTIKNDKHIPILHTATKIFPSLLKAFQLKRVLYTPHLTTNLVNVSQF